jgi:hypothetical protein
MGGPPSDTKYVPFTSTVETLYCVGYLSGCSTLVGDVPKVRAKSGLRSNWL